MRLFVAVPIPENVLSEIHKVQLELQAGLNKSVRWTNPASIHLTVKFLGETSANRIVDISRTMEDISSQVSLFSMVCCGIGVFPNIKHPAVVWLGLESPPELFVLQKELETSLSHQGFAAENRAFSPHLTLGRVQMPFSMQEMEFLKQKIDEYLHQKIATIKVENLKLVKSNLLPTGPVYTTQRNFPLKAEK